MSKRLLMALAVLVFILSACANQTGTKEVDHPATETRVVDNTATLSPTAMATDPVNTPESAVINAPVGCQTYSGIEGPTTDELSRFPASMPGDWTRGPEGAPITIIEYGDFQCPSCAALEPMLTRLTEAFPGQIRIIFRHFPLAGFPDKPVHDKALLSAQAAEAAGRQGVAQFWAMHTLLFSQQQTWTSLTSEEFEIWLLTQAADLGLDIDLFQTDLSSPEIVAQAENAWLQGVANNLSGTPSLVINGRLMDGTPLTYSNLESMVRLMLLEKRQYATCPLITIDQSRRYVAILHTTKGEIMLELFADKAPLTVNNFVFLAREGFYDHVTFHRVLSGFMAQSGDPSGTGFGGPGYTFINEIVNGLTFDRSGRLAMVNSGPDTNGSQFFITFGPAEHLTGEYTIFGQVIGGMDVLSQLTPRNPDQGMNLPPGDLIQTITIEEK